jgi:hypothetical protein
MSDQGPVNAFETVQTLTRATMYADLGAKRNESFVKVTGVKVFG